MSRPLPRAPLSHPLRFSRLTIGAAPLLPQAANDLRFGTAPGSVAPRRSAADFAYRARFWRIALPALGLFWAGIGAWVLA